MIVGHPFSPRIEKDAGLHRTPYAVLFPNGWCDAASLSTSTSSSSFYPLRDQQSLPLRGSFLFRGPGALTFGYGCAVHARVEIGAGDVEVDVIYITFIMSAHYIGSAQCVHSPACRYRTATGAFPTQPTGPGKSTVPAAGAK